MRKLLLTLSFIFSLFILHPSMALERETVRLKSSQQVRFPVYHIDDEKCHVLKVKKVRVKKDAQNGSFSTSQEEIKIPAGHACAGHTLKVMMLIYKPEPGFKGKDSVRISWISERFADGTGRVPIEYELTYIVDE